jgi:subtilisin family serine protease
MSFGLSANYFVGPFGFGVSFPNVSQINYRGTISSYPASAPPGQTAQQATYNGRWDPQTFLNAGINLFYEYYNLYQIALLFSSGQDTAMNQAIVDSMNANEGIIWCAAAGNDYDKSGVNSNNTDYNNTNNRLYAVFGGVIPLYTNYFPYRLATPAFAATGTPNANDWKKVIVTANVGVVDDEGLSISSTVGDACDVCSPGTNIMSPYTSAGVADPRNAAYFLDKLTGTSMASPQTAGLIACMMEQYPNATQMEARTYIKNFANNGVMYDANVQCPPNNPLYSLRGAPNQLATYYPDRPPTGNPWPQSRFWLRPTSGSVYPRPTIQRRNVV